MIRPDRTRSGSRIGLFVGPHATVAAERQHSGTAVAVVLFAIMVAGIGYRYWPSDERAIRRHLSNLAETLSVPAAESEVAHLTRVAAMREYFAPDIRLRAGSEQTISREALIAAIGRWPIPPGGLGVEFADIAVSVAEDHESATVSLTAKVASTNPQTGESTLDVQAAAGEMRKADGDWVITSVEPRDPPPPR